MLTKPFSLKVRSGLARNESAPLQSSRNAWAWAAVGTVAGAFLALVIHLPAQWMGQALSNATLGQVQLQEARGSVWNGSGRLVLTGGEGSRDALALPGRVTWQIGLAFNQNMLSGLGFNLNLHAACCMAQAAQLSFTPTPHLQTWQLHVSNHRSQWPAHLLSGLGAPWNTMQPEGTLILETKQLLLNVDQGKAWLQGGLTLTADNMSSKLSTLRPMGSYQVNLDGSTTPHAMPSLTLTTQSGSLLLSGQGQWQGSRFQFRGEATAVPEHAAALSSLLNIIGRRQGARSLLSLG